jgi:hypothetical protein
MAASDKLGAQFQQDEKGEPYDAYVDTRLEQQIPLGRSPGKRPPWSASRKYDD